jgi:hypothetical protein
VPHATHAQKSFVARCSDNDDRAEEGRHAPQTLMLLPRAETNPDEAASFRCLTLCCIKARHAFGARFFC